MVRLRGNQMRRKLNWCIKNYCTDEKKTEKKQRVKTNGKIS